MKSFTQQFANVVIAVSMLLVSSAALRGQETAAAGNRWAILVGAEKYHRANPLKYTVNDVKQLSSTLKNRGGYDADRVLEMTDDATNPRFQPLKTSMMTELPNWFKRVGPNDMILVYFSGHGFRDSTGKLYLAPLDCDPANAAATGVPVEWLREQIASCKARDKLLVLDACHAGSEKGDDDGPGVAAKDLGTEFENLAGVMTIASSEATEKSQIWDEKHQSLFSFWLNQALKGHADQNGDGVVDVHELYDFVYRNVTHTAQARFPRPQTPVRIVRTGIIGVPVVEQLQPQSLRQLLNDIADQLADNIAERKLAKVGVLEFTNDTPVGELLGANYGSLGKWCADELERKLMQSGTGKFNIVDRRRFQKALKDEGFQLEDLGSGPKLKQLSKEAGGMPVLAVGTLANRKGRVVTIQCKLQCLDSDDMAGSAGGRAVLNESEWAMLGRSAEIKADDHRPEPPSIHGNAVPVSIEDTVVDHADERAKERHPLQDPNFQFPIKFMVGGKERKPVFKKVGEDDNQHWDCYVPVSAGETYEVWVQNRSGASAIMRLLVDGLNTKLEKEDTKGVETTVWGKRVNLDEAAGWILDPAGNPFKIGGYPMWRVQGFETATGEEGIMRQFTVVDAEKSLAARQKFTDQLGLVTAAFYQENTSRGAVGTDAGSEIKVKIKQRKAEVGNLLAVVHIRYVDASTLQNDGKK